MIEQLVTAISTACSLIIALYAVMQVKRARSSIPSLDDFVWQEGEEWKCDERIGKLVDFFGSRMAHSLKQSIFQAQGVPAKLEKGMKAAIAQDIAEQKMPLALMVGDLLGINARAYIKRNPDALFALVSDPRVQKFIGGFMNQNSGSRSGQGEM